MFDEFDSGNEQNVRVVQDYIKSKSQQYADEQNSPISTKPINIVIEAPDVCNISLIDLPGLIAVPKQQNQYELIDKINSLVSHYISRPNAIIVVMIQAGTDLETNIALALLKKYNYHLSNCIGVLTKLDLTDSSDASINDILYGLPEAFRMEYGYFAIQCKNTSNISNVLYQSIGKNNIQSQQINKNKLTNRMGIENLLQFLTKLLIHHLGIIMINLLKQSIRLTVTFKQN